MILGKEANVLGQCIERCHLVVHLDLDAVLGLLDACKQWARCFGDAVSSSEVRARNAEAITLWTVWVR